MPEVVTPADSRAATGPRASTRIAVLLVAACVACLSVAGIFLIASPPAAAHDQLLSSDPADGDELDAMPAAITLTFSGEPLATGAEVVLTGEDGNAVSLRDIAVDGAVLTATVPATLPGGDYDAAWHIVSGDGHPLEGAFSFTVAGPEPSAAPEDAEPVEDSTEAASANPGETPEPDEPTGAGRDVGAGSADASPETSAGIPSGAAGLALIGGLAVVLVMLVVRWRRMEHDATRRRRDRGDAAGTGSADGNSGDRDRSSDGDSGSDSGSGSGGDSGGGGGE
ncbi:copper resistance CopC family protein [Myceligenerans xiligouense]|uniref:CopC domain-containing protein n=1 Tax=Myceligenerans xiligouense TaxID=253184 RepID=A0A3N4YST8_9MICO|nr:copper resistance protein CopC [Myceligenerans xiligouense]RPF23287.1 hypothetical protein EDD34_3972 [Myceligenerans xiligouense]